MIWGPERVLGKEVRSLAEVVIKTINKGKNIKHEALGHEPNYQGLRDNFLWGQVISQLPSADFISLKRLVLTTSGDNETQALPD